MVVSEQHLAHTMGSGDLAVLATPAMIALMENAAMLCAQPLLSPKQSTVGGQINATHIKPTALGQEVWAEAKLTQQEGRKLHFTITAHDSQGLIGQGEHLRFIIDKEKFMSKL